MLRAPQLFPSGFCREIGRVPLAWSLSLSRARTALARAPPLAPDRGPPSVAPSCSATVSCGRASSRPARSGNCASWCAIGPASSASGRGRSTARPRCSRGAATIRLGSVSTNLGGVSGRAILAACAASAMSSRQHWPTRWGAPAVPGRRPAASPRRPRRAHRAARCRDQGAPPSRPGSAAERLATHTDDRSEHETGPLGGCEGIRRRGLGHPRCRPWTSCSSCTSGGSADRPARSANAPRSPPVRQPSSRRSPSRSRRASSTASLSRSPLPPDPRPRPRLIHGYTREFQLRNPGQELIERISTIPGAGGRTAVVILVEIGSRHGPLRLGPLACLLGWDVPRHLRDRGRPAERQDAGLPSAPSWRSATRSWASSTRSSAAAARSRISASPPSTAATRTAFDDG